MIRRWWDRLLTWLRIREPYREPSHGLGFMLDLMAKRLEELENRRH